MCHLKTGPAELREYEGVHQLISPGRSCAHRMTAPFLAPGPGSIRERVCGGIPWVSQQPACVHSPTPEPCIHWFYEILIDALSVTPGLFLKVPRVVGVSFVF